MAVIIPIVSKFDDKGLKNAKSQFGQLGAGMKKALGAAATVASIGAIGVALEKAAKAATADAKSAGLLATSLKNVTGASDQVIASVEASIQKMSMMAGVADDQIRPAFSQLVRATGDVGEATGLTSLALDVAAAKGISVETAAIALGKAAQGNAGALAKLGIKVKGLANPLAEVQKQFAGSAEAAANLDPFQRLQIVFGELQESLGRAVLPVVQAFAKFMVDNAPTIDAFFGKLGEVLEAVMPLLKPLFEAVMKLAMAIGDALLIVIPPLIKVFEALIPILNPIIELIAYLLEAILTPLAGFIEKILVPIIDFLAQAFVDFMPYVDALASALGQTLSLSLEYLMELFGYLWEFIQPVIKAFKDFEKATGIDLTQLMIQVSPLIAGIKILNAGLVGSITALRLMRAAVTGNWGDFGKILADGGKELEKIFNPKVTENKTAKLIEDTAGKFKFDYTPAIIENTGAQKKNTDAQKANSEARKKYWQELVKTREKLKEEAEALAEAQDAMRDATAGIKTLMDTSVDMGEFESRVVDTFTNIKDVISSSLADGKITRSAAYNLSALADSTQASIQAIAKQRDALIAKRSLVEALIGDVKGSLMGAGNITGLLETQSKTVTKTVTSIINGLSVAVSSTTEEITSGGLLKNFKSVLDKTKAFAGQLKELRKLGLDQNLFKQIVDAGADAGGAVAAEIIAGGADAVNEINGVYKDLADVSGQIAEQTAVVMYNDGKDVAGGLVAGLLAQEQALKDAATTLANAFMNTFNSMISGLTLPSQAGKGISGLNANGFAYSSNPLLGGTMESQFGSGTPWAQAVARNANPNTPINIVVNAGLVSSPEQVGADINTALNAYKRANGEV